MVEHGIVLGHVVSSKGIEINQDKIDIISTLSYSTSMQEVFLFLDMQVFSENSSMISQKLELLCSNSYRKIWPSNLMLSVREHSTS